MNSAALSTLTYKNAKLILGSTALNDIMIGPTLASVWRE